MSQTNKRLTLNDIAKLSGVSKTTVSMILNGRAAQFRIKAETIQKVQQIAQQHNYQANLYAKALQARRTNTIGLVIPDFANLGFATMATRLERLCRDSGLQLLITCSDEQPEQEKIAIEKLLARQIDLLITTPTKLTLEHYASTHFDIPVIQLDRATLNSPYPSIVTDDKSAVEKLINKMVTHYQLTECYYLGGQAELRPSIERLAGFKQGLQQAGLVCLDDWIIQTRYHADYAYQALHSIYQQNKRLPQALFTGSYALLEGALHFLNDYKLTQQLIDKRFILATFDDYELLNCLPFHIHSIKQDYPQITQQLFKAIQTALNGSTVESQVIPAQILWRDA